VMANRKMLSVNEETVRNQVERRVGRLMALRDRG
jgi:hypothetical protein